MPFDSASVCFWKLLPIPDSLTVVRFREPNVLQNTAQTFVSCQTFAEDIIKSLCKHYWEIQFPHRKKKKKNCSGPGNKHFFFLATASSYKPTWCRPDSGSWGPRSWCQKKSQHGSGWRWWPCAEGRVPSSERGYACCVSGFWPHLPPSHGWTPPNIINVQLVLVFILQQWTMRGILFGCSDAPNFFTTEHKWGILNRKHYTD